MFEKFMINDSGSSLVALESSVSVFTISSMIKVCAMQSTIFGYGILSKSFNYP